MPAMIRANDKIEREREVRDRLPEALLIEILPHQTTVVDCDLTVHKN